MAFFHPGMEGTCSGYLDSRTAFWVHYELNAREIAGVANLQKTLPDGVTITGIECSPSVITVSKSFFLARIQF